MASKPQSEERAKQPRTNAPASAWSKHTMQATISAKGAGAGEGTYGTADGKHGLEEAKMALRILAKSAKKKLREQNKERTCTFCQKKGHVKEQCIARPLEFAALSGRKKKYALALAHAPRADIEKDF